MKYALANMGEREGGYLISYGKQPTRDFGSGGEKYEWPTMNPLAAAYPVLFPYGVGGIEAQRERFIGFDEHVRWALQYYDRQFRTHHSFIFVTFSIEQKRQALRSA